MHKLLRRKAMDAMNEALNKPTEYPAADKDYKNPWFFKGTEPQLDKTGGEKRYHYVTNCTSSDQDSIHELQAKAMAVSFRELSKNCAGLDEFKKDLGYGPRSGLSLSKDWSVGFYKSEYRGVPCYYIEHSHIEYIFTLNGEHPERPEENEDEEPKMAKLTPRSEPKGPNKEAFTFGKKGPASTDQAYEDACADAISALRLLHDLTKDANIRTCAWMSYQDLKHFMAQERAAKGSAGKAAPGKAASQKRAEIKMHKEPKMLPPRTDQRSYLDEDLKKELDADKKEASVRRTSPLLDKKK